MKRSHAKAMVGLLISTWPKPDTAIDTQLAWEELLVLERFEMVDWTEAIRELTDPPRAFCPHISEVIVVAVQLYHERLREAAPALPPERDDRPACCQAEGGWTFAHWRDVHATPEEIEKAQKFGVAQMVESA